MVVMDLADEGHEATAGGTAHVPPLVPMVMQLINEYAGHTVELPCTDPLLLAMPGWHQKGRVLADEIDNSQNINMPNQMSRVRHLQLQVAKHPKWASLVPQSVRNMVTNLECECWPIDSRVVLSLRKLTDFTLRLFDDEGDHSHDTNDDTVIDWLPSISTLENVDVYGDYVTKFFTDTSLRGLETLPSLKSVYLLQCDLSNLNGLSRAAALTSIFVESDSLTSSGIEDLWRCPALQRVGLLNCSNLIDISALAKCRTLNELCLAGAFCTHPSVVDVCRNVPTLTSLRLSIIDHAAALAIAAMPSLKLRLVSSSLDPPDLAFDLLKLTLPCLEELQLKCCDGVIAWSTCRHLTDLTVTEAYSIDLSALAALPTLTNLELGDLCNTVTWAGSLRDSKSLATFAAYQDDLLEDLHHIQTLTELHCWVQSDRTLECVNACSRLKVLWVSGALVTNKRLAALHDLAYIEEIVLSACSNVTNVDVLLEPKFPSLKRVYLSYTSISDEDAYSARLSLRLARRQLHTSWFLLRDEDDAAEP